MICGRIGLCILIPSTLLAACSAAEPDWSKSSTHEIEGYRVTRLSGEVHPNRRESIIWVDDRTLLFVGSDMAAAPDPRGPEWSETLYSWSAAQPAALEVARPASQLCRSDEGFAFVTRRDGVMRGARLDASLGVTPDEVTWIGSNLQATNLRWLRQVEGGYFSYAYCRMRSKGASETRPLPLGFGRLSAPQAGTFDLLDDSGSVVRAAAIPDLILSSGPFREPTVVPVPWSDALLVRWNLPASYFQGKQRKAYLLRRDGSTEEFLLPDVAAQSAVVPLITREGWFVTLSSAEAGVGEGLYRVRQGDIELIRRGHLDRPSVSPDGCRIAYVHNPSLRSNPGGRDDHIEILEVCTD